MYTRSTSSIALLTALITWGPSAHAEWVLPPQAASAVKGAVDVQKKADAGGWLRSASIEKTKIIVESRSSDGSRTSKVTLIHPSVAPDGAFLGAGVALIEAPGPVDPDALSALKKALKSTKRVIPWVETQDDDADDAASEANAAAAIDRARRAMKSGQDAQKVSAALDALPSKLPAPLAVRAAILYKALGDEARALATLAEVAEGDTPSQLSAAILRGKSASPEAIIGKRPDAEVCGLREVVQTLAALGRLDEAMVLGEAIFARAPLCPEAWEMMIHRHLAANANDEALKLVDASSKRFKPSDTTEGLLAIQGSVWLQAGRFGDASKALEAVAIRAPSDEGSVRMLLSATLRDAARRGEHIARLEAQKKAGALTPPATLVLAALYHNDNRFDDSNALLDALEGPIATQSRPQIYRALNSFNLGRDDEALNLLKPLMAKSDPDPFAYYCHAELIRKRDREQAKRDLGQYLSLVKREGVSNPAQVKRIEALLAHLDTCIEERMAICPGEWENPRIRKDAAPLTAQEQSARRQSGDTVDSRGVRWDKPVHDVNMVIDVATTPEDYGGNLFLVGFRELDIGNQPVDNLDIAHYHQLAMRLQRFPYRAKVELVEGINYRAVYSHNDFPLIGDAVSTFFRIGDNPPGSVSVVVNRYGHERNDGSTGSTPVLNWKGAANQDPDKSGVTIYIDPPPSNKKGKVFVAGFKVLNTDTGTPNRDALPADYHTVKGVDKGLPLRIQLPLVKGLHYIAVYGHGMFPADGDRMSNTITFAGEDNVLFSIGTTPMPPTKDSFDLAKDMGEFETKEGPESPQAPQAPEATSEDAMQRTWMALLFGLLAIVGVVLLARRGRES